MIEKNKTFFSLLLFMIIVISILPGTSALAMDGKGKQITEFILDSSDEELNMLHPKKLHDASWYKEDAVYARLMNMKNSYPEGMTWTDDNYYYTSYIWYGRKDGEDGYGRGMRATGCAGFAFLMSDEAFDDLPMYVDYNVSLSKLRVGDILRLENDSHSVVILQINSGSVTVAEGNYGGKIHWGRTIYKAEVERSDYILSRWPGVPDTTFFIKYDANGGTGAPETDYSVSGDYASLSLDQPVRNGYFFLGWDENKNAVTPTYLAGDYCYINMNRNITLYAVWSKPDFVLPASLTTIGTEAFSGGAFRFVKLSEKTVSIGKKAFSNCGNLRYIYIPEATSSIDAEAFGNQKTVTIICPQYSNACSFAYNNGFSRIIIR